MMRQSQRTRHERRQKRVLLEADQEVAVVVDEVEEVDSEEVADVVVDVVSKRLERDWYGEELVTNNLVRDKETQRSSIDSFTRAERF
jgi:hypothetical protein